MNFSSIVGSLDANSSFLGSLDANSSFLGDDVLLVSFPQLVQNVFPSKILLPHLLHEFEIFFDNLLSVLGLMYGSFVVALTSVILNDDSVDFLTLGKLFGCLSDAFILLVICLCLGVKYCSTSASTYFLSCIEIILLF